MLLLLEVLELSLESRAESKELVVVDCELGGGGGGAMFATSVCTVCMALAAVVRSPEFRAVLMAAKSLGTLPCVFIFASMAA